MSPKKPQVRRVPQRTCIVCGMTSAKRTLTRLVRTAEEGVEIDPTGKREGRGAYLCDNPQCWEIALKGSVLSKALRTSLKDRDLARLREAAPRPHGEAPM